MTSCFEPYINRYSKDNFFRQITVALSHSHPDFLLCPLLLVWWAAVYSLGLAWPHLARTDVKLPGIWPSGLLPERLHPCYRLWREGLQATEHLMSVCPFVSFFRVLCNIETALLSTCPDEDAVQKGLV